MAERNVGSLAKLTPWKLDETPLTSFVYTADGIAPLIAFGGWSGAPITVEASKKAPLPMSPLLLQYILEIGSAGHSSQRFEDVDYFWINKIPKISDLFRAGAKVVVITCADFLDASTTAGVVSRVKPVLMALEASLIANKISLLFVGPKSGKAFPFGRSFLPSDSIVTVEGAYSATLPAYYYPGSPTNAPGNHWNDRQPPTSVSASITDTEFIPVVDSSKWVSGGEFLSISIQRTWFNGQGSFVPGSPIPGLFAVSVPLSFPLQYQFVLVAYVADVVPGAFQPQFIVTGYTGAGFVFEEMKSASLTNVFQTFGSDLFSRSQVCVASLNDTNIGSGTPSALHSEFLAMSLEVVDEIVDSVSGNHVVFDPWPASGSDTTALLNQVKDWITAFFSL